jgi:hypothetical protein
MDFGLEIVRSNSMTKRARPSSSLLKVTGMRTFALPAGPWNHPAKSLLGEAAAEFQTQFSRQCRDNFFTVGRALALANVGADTVADLPIEQDQRGIDGLRDAFTRFLE